jgi:hypothetical protein
MPVTVLGSIALDAAPDGATAQAPQAASVATLARLHEVSGFDGLLLPFDVPEGEGPAVLDAAVAATRDIGFVLHATRQGQLHGHVQGREVLYGRDAQAEADAAPRGDADLVVLPAGSFQAVAQTVRRLRRAAQRQGHDPAFLLRVRPVLGATREAAWQRARALEAELGGQGAPAQRGEEGLARLLNVVRLDSHARCAWPDLARLDGRGGAIGLVGTPEQVARALLDYYDIGVEHFVLHGFDPQRDAIDHGRELIPLLRRKVAQRAALLSVLAG